jgi:hypothetical protein
VFAAPRRVSTHSRKQAVANFVVHLGLLPWCVPDDVMCSLLDAGRRVCDGLSPMDLRQLLLGLAWLSAPGRARVAVPADVQAVMLRALDREVPHLSGSQLTNCLEALGLLLWPFSEALAANLIRKYTADDMQRQLRMLDVRSAVVGLAGLRSVVSSVLLATAHTATCAAAARVAAYWSVNEVAECVRALGRLRWRLTPRVISLFDAWAITRAEELQPAQLAWMLLGLANSQSPLGAEAMARLLGQVDDKLRAAGRRLNDAAIQQPRPDRSEPARAHRACRAGCHHCAGHSHWPRAPCRVARAHADPDTTGACHPAQLHCCTATCLRPAIPHLTPR